MDTEQTDAEAWRQVVELAKRAGTQMGLGVAVAALVRDRVPGVRVPEG